MNKISLQHILFVSFTLFASVPVIVLAFWIQHSITEKEIATVEAKHLLIARNLKNELSRYISDIESAFSTTTQNIEQGKNVKPLSGVLDLLHFRYFLVLDNKQNILTSFSVQNQKSQFTAAPDRIAAEFSPRLGQMLAQSLSHKHKVFFSDLVLDANNEITLFLIKPIAKDRFVVASVSPEHIRDIQKSIKFGQRGRATIVDKKGRIIAHPNAKWVEEMKDFSHADIVKKMLHGQSGVMSFHSQSLDMEMLAGYTVVSSVGWGVMVHQPEIEVTEQLNQIRIVTLLLVLPGILIAALISWLLAARLSSPIRSIVESTKQAEGDGFISQIKAPFRFIPYEINRLVSSVNKMIFQINEKNNVLEQTSMRLADSQRIAHIGNWELDIDNDVLWCSDEFYHICDINMDYFGGTYQELLELIHPDDRKMFESTVKQAQRQGGRFRIEHRIRLRNQEDCFVYHEGEMVIDNKTKKRHIIGVIHDITERHQYENKLFHQANYDDVTGLPNRTLFLQYLNQEAQNASRKNTKIALFTVNLDEFKFINDTHGHIVGDKLLKKAADRMSSLIRESDILARKGGDEFSILLRNVNDPNDCTNIANKIIRAMESVFIIDNLEAFISASIGITLLPDDAEEPVSIIRNADIALCSAKKAGKGNHCFYKPEMDRENNRRMILSNELRRSVENDEISVNFQPIIDIHSGEIVSAEALVRWQHPDLGFISPMEFIPIAEDSGLIGPIGNFVLQTACENAALWMDLMDKPPRISVNLSVKQIKLGLSKDLIHNILVTTGLAPDRLSLEITESMVIGDIDKSVEWMNSIRECGISFSIDDFGTGYSSLSYLKRLPVDTLKIDRSFINDVTKDPEDASLVEAIIAIAKSLRLSIVAEGTEHKEQIEYLASHQCDCAQGYYYSKPIAADEFAILLKSWKPEKFLALNESKKTG